MEEKKLNFKDCTQKLLDETFNLKQVINHKALRNWITSEMQLTDFEIKTLEYLQENLMLRAHTWNETELRDKFIGPVMALVNFDSDDVQYFAERSLSGTVESLKLSGRVDGMIAKGKWEPEKTYFCMNEYKKEKDPQGDPGAQALAAMMVAQEQNVHPIPVYGLYVKGKLWYFMILLGKEYGISEPYTASLEHIFDIFRILKTLRQIICGIVESEKTG
ncbi:MAG TPA: hypothetical protein ENK58_02875 [Desulfobacterales bacterium]|nr:hypothetical protein [Desulfobacterales bacterium]